MLFNKPLGSKCIILEGNIGAGKSTLLSLMQSIKDLVVVYEPVDMWQNIEGNNLLKQFYADPQRWSYAFQSYAFLTRVLAAQRAMDQSSATLYVLERSVYSDRYCFAKNAVETGLMSNLEWAMYKEWFDWLVIKNTFLPDGFIYMSTSPTTCLKRIAHRDRTEEHGIQYAYLEQLHNKHEEWLVQKQHCSSLLQTVPVITIDCDKEFEHDKEYRQYIIKQLQLFINHI